MNNLIEFVISKISQVTANVYDEKSTTMVSTRLKRRMLELNMSAPEEYLSFLKSHYQEEEPLLIELLTTHHTFLFREIIHFEYLKDNLDKIVNHIRSQGRNKIRVWSAAASTGQEAYSLALFLDQEIKNKYPGMDFEIVGTDIAQQSIDTATQGIYPYEKVKEIPAHFLEGYWSRFKELGKDCAQVEPFIRSKCKFQTHNILQPLMLHDKFDIIFCRNVFIYFSEENIKRSIVNLYSKLEAHGLIFTGVSEPIGNYSTEIAKVGPCIYKRKIDTTDEYIATPETARERYNVVTVDDSPAVLKILKKIFEDDCRYNLVQQCKDGNELASFLKDTNEKVDLITLDLHMPNLDGVGYLEKYFNSKHPPVLIVSSVNRDNQDLGQKAIKLGAFDYVEKPNFKNFDQCSEELKNKIITFLSLSNKKVSSPTLKAPVPFAPTPSRSLTTQVNVKTIPLYIFSAEHSHSNIRILLEEIFEQGFIPKHIIASTHEIKDSLYKNFQEFYTLKGQRDVVDKIKFSRSLDFYVSEKVFLKSEDKPIFCMYQGADAYTYLNEYIPYDSYILSEKQILHTQHHIDSMPSTSWGFHVLDFLKHDQFTHDTIYEWAKFEGQTHELPYRSALVVFYKKNIPIAFIEAKNLTHSFNRIESFLEKKQTTTGYKIAAPLTIGKKVKSFLDEKGLKALNLYKTSSDSLYNLHNGLLRIKAHKKKPISSPPISMPSSTSKAANKISVLIIDDSKTLTKILKKHIESDSQIDCVAVHHDTKELEKDIISKRPQVITLDMNMPDMDGAEIYERIIKKYNIPTILLTSSDKNSKKVLKALNSGVVDYIQKPALNELTHGKFPLIARIKDVVGAKVRSLDLAPSTSRIPTSQYEKSLIFIGASTGGTRAISYMLSSFPRTIPPVIVGQHIPENYSLSFAELLNEKNPFTVKEAKHNEEVQNNTVYIAPGGRHTSIQQERGKLIFKVLDHVAGARFTPSIDFLFESASQLKGYNMVATILTGMGKDGAQSLKLLKNVGAITLAQDKDSSVVYGMPRAAYEMGSATKQVNLSSMSHELFESLKVLNRKAS